MEFAADKPSCPQKNVSRLPENTLSSPFFGPSVKFRKIKPHRVNCIIAVHATRSDGEV